MMKELLKVEIQTIAIVHIIAIVLAIIFFMIFYMKANKTHALKSFLVLQLSMIGWMVFKVFKTVSPTVISRWWFIVAYYFCACILEAAFLEFGYAYYKGKPLGNKVRWLVYLFPILQFIVIITNPYHHLFYARYDFWGDSFGILFYVHTLIEYVFIAIGFVFCYRQFKVKFRHSKLWYKYLVSSAILVPLILNFLFITKVIHKIVSAIGLPVVFDITPIVFTWSVLVFVYATFTAEFLSLSPILKHEIVHKLDTPICVLDSSVDVIYMNEKIQELFEGKAKEIIKKTIGLLNVSKDKRVEVSVEHYYLDVRINIVNTLIEIQYILTIKDITPYKNMQSELSKRQTTLNYTNNLLEETIETLKESSKIGARGYVARELHDIIGHSLVVTIKLLEVAKVYFKKDKEMSLLATVDAYKSIENGILNMEAIQDRHNNEVQYSGESLRNELAKMLINVKNTGIKTKLHFKGVFHNISSDIHGVIEKVCMELLTNSIKHSRCNEIFISVTVGEDDINIMVMDNGIGVDQLTRGSGLTGIEERLGMLNGKVQFFTSKGEGFMSKIHISN